MPLHFSPQLKLIGVWAWWCAEHSADYCLLRGRNPRGCQL